MTHSNLFLDPRYAALMSAARAMLEQQPSSAPPLFDQEKLRRWAPFVRSARAETDGLADPVGASSGTRTSAIQT